MRRKVSAAVRKVLLINLPILIFWGLCVSAQSPKQANIWYFGEEAGLDFSNGNPVAITDGVMSAFEGTAVLSDATGKLLFYTNGGDLPYAGGVWNRNHQLMPNGDLNSVGGCGSSFQSSIIVQHSKHQNLYYLFTTDCIENNSVGGLRYSIIDMTLDGGLGDITVKGQLLTTPVDESLTAIRHANGEDYWIITHKIHTDSFYVYHLTYTGITGLVKTRIGPVTPDYAGALKSASNGQKIVHSGLDFTALYDFDNTTGIISEYVDLGIPSYSAAFSPNCQFLYIADGIGKNIYQFDVTTGDIPASAILVGNTSSTGFGAMQLGPNGRIYVAKFVSSNYLGTILYPNYKGVACQYIDNGIYLAGKFGKGGLPNYANDIVGQCAPYKEENEEYTNRYSRYDIRSDFVSGSNFRVFWEGPGDANKKSHCVLYKKSGSDNWMEYITNKNSLTFEGMEPKTTYHVKVMPYFRDHPNYEYLNNHFIDQMVNEQSKKDVSDNEIIITTLENFKFDLYPNPAVNSSNLSINTGDQAASLDIIIMEANGKIIEEYNYDNVMGANDFTISTEDLINGIYHVAVQSDDAYYIKKLIVMK